MRDTAPFCVFRIVYYLNDIQIKSLIMRSWIYYCPRYIKIFKAMFLGFIATEEPDPPVFTLKV